MTYDKDHKLFNTKPKSSNKLNWFVVVALLISPIVISIISAIHVYEFFMIGNSQWLSVALAVSFELLAMAALVALWELRILSKSTQWFLWGMIAMLVILMISGNVYSVWLHLNQEMVDSAAVLISMESGNIVKRLISFFQGAILPIMSLSFIKILANYIIQKKQ